MPHVGDDLGLGGDELPQPKIALRSNSMLTQRAAVVAGAGAMVCDALQAHAAGLVPVPVTYRAPPPLPAYLVMQRQRAQAPRVRMVVDFIEAVCRRMERTGHLPRTLDEMLGV